MFGHPLELVIVLVLALIFFGPEKLPEVAATAGKFVRELRESVSAATNPEEPNLPDDFSTYYYDSLARSDEGAVDVDEMPDPADDGAEHTHSEGVHTEPLESEDAHTETEHIEALQTDPAQTPGLPPGSHPWDGIDSVDDLDESPDPAATAPRTEPHAEDDRQYHP